MALVGLWAVGFGWFVQAAGRPAVLPPDADGIVALTGGAERVETALRLLASGHGHLLLISGVNRAADFHDLARRAGFDAGAAGGAALENRVTLGRTASDTHGNAIEAAAWARENDVRSLILVTAGYHMPRALAELSRTLPDVTLYPYPVISPVLRGRFGGSSLRLLFAEYTKFLATEARLSGLGPHELARDADGEPPGPPRTRQDQSPG